MAARMDGEALIELRLALFVDHRLAVRDAAPVSAI
jgi:hypothetical protein